VRGIRDGRLWTWGAFAITSRVWLTLLEVVPGFVFWTHAAVNRRPPTRDPSDVPT
jgi:hypothetical protein